MFKAILKFFKPKTPFQKNMRMARIMMKLAREDFDDGYHCAGHAAIEAAKAYRKAAHAHKYYGM